MRHHPPSMLVQLILLRRRFGKRYVCVIHQSRRRTDLRVDDARSIKHFKLIPVLCDAYACVCIRFTVYPMRAAIYANRTYSQVYSFAQPERANMHSHEILYLKKQLMRYQYLLSVAFSRKISLPNLSSKMDNFFQIHQQYRVIYEPL